MNKTYVKTELLGVVDKHQQFVSKIQYNYAVNENETYAIVLMLNGRRLPISDNENFRNQNVPQNEAFIIHIEIEKYKTE